jgi:hypothetical protein
MADNYTQLNPGIGGDIMDEVSVNYGVAPVTRKRPRVVLTGGTVNSDVEVVSSRPDGSARGLVTRPILDTRVYPGDDVFHYGTVSAVPAGVETTVVTYIVPAESTVFVLGFSASGLFKAKYTLYLDDMARLSGWTTAANLNLQMSFLGLAPPVAESFTIRLSVLHGESGSQTDFSGTILGYEVGNPTPVAPAVPLRAGRSPVSVGSTKVLADGRVITRSEYERSEAMQVRADDLQPE